ncbi:MAG: class I SAM-dependent methyltransferase [Gemmatimonadota bacterium]
MPFHDHFSAHAGGYAAHRPSYPPELVDYLVGLAPRAGLAWDAGCGSGQLSTLLAERFDRVIATDPSAEQLARAPAHPRIEYREATAEHGGLADASVDLAVAAQAAHWFDLAAYFREVHRVTATDAAIALISYGGTRITPELDPIVEGFRVDELEAFWPPQRIHVEDGYRSLPFPFRETRAPSFEIRLEWTLDDLLAYMRTWSALRSLEPADAAALLEDLRERLAPGWGADEVVRTVAWPLSLRVGYV